MPTHELPDDRPPLDDEVAHAKAVHQRANQICPAHHRAGGDIDKVPCADCYRKAEAQITAEQAT